MSFSKWRRSGPKNKAARYVLWVLTSTQMTHFSSHRGWAWVENERGCGSQSRESKSGYKSLWISLPLKPFCHVSTPTPPHTHIFTLSLWSSEAPLSLPLKNSISLGINSIDVAYEMTSTHEFSAFGFQFGRLSHREPVKWVHWRHNGGIPLLESLTQNPTN